ncbi:putative reverse transcriptase domain-containing protein [Tanacetum coccineum]
MEWEDFKTLMREIVRDDNKSTRDRNVRDDSKSTRTGNAFATTTNPVRREYTGTSPKCANCNLHHPPESPCLVCFNCNRPGQIAKDCRAPRMVNPVNARNPTAVPRACFECGGTNHLKAGCPRLNQAQRPEGNRQIQAVANNGGQGHGNNDNQERGRAFMPGAEEACQDPNIVTYTFTLNNHYATTLFDSGAEYSFVSTTFISLLSLEPSDLGFSYEIKIASGQLVEINKVIRGCKLEIEGHIFDIDLIPFGEGSFDNPTKNGEGLRVIGERPDEKMRHLMSAKANEQKLEEIVMVRDFSKVFPDDLSRLPPIQEIQFCIELIPGVVLVAKSPYRLASSKMEELSGQLKELQDKALPDGSEDFVVYCDASGLGLGCVLMQRGKIELFSDYDCKIHYHPGKAIVVADALSRKERIKPRRVRAMNMTLQSSIKDKILAAQGEASDEIAGMQQGLDEMMERNEAHKSKYSVHPGADKMYYDIRDRYWWPGMKKDVAMYVSKCLTHLKVKDFKIDRLARLYLDEIMVRHGVPVSIISDRDDHFTLRFWQSMQEALGTRLDMSMAYHPQTDGQSERTIQTLEDMLKACFLDFGGSCDVHLPLVEFSYNNSYHYSIGCAPFEALYGRKCRLPILWVEIREGQLIGTEIVQETTEKISQIKDRLKIARDCQKNYADKRRKHLEFEVGDHVMPKVAPWKGVVRFRKKWKLAPRFVGPFEITERIGKIAYRLRLPQELNNVHDTFNVLNLKKCLADPTLQVPLDEIQVDDKLNFVEEPMEILEREFKKLK